MIANPDVLPRQIHKFNANTTPRGHEPSKDPNLETDPREKSKAGAYSKDSRPSDLASPRTRAEDEDQS